MANNNKLNFYIGDESKLVIEKPFIIKESNDEEYNDSLFQNMFGRVLNEIEVVLPEICDTLSEEQTNEQIIDSPLVEKSINNIFGFIGDRGSGKSSSMMSVALSLKNSYELTRIEPQKFPHIVGHKFLVMETIDPSFFDNKVNILDIVIGKMYLKFKKDIGNNQVNNASRNDLLDCFQTVRRCIANNGGITDISEDDDIESLEYLSSGVELQNAMQQLINKYLGFYRRNVLVIPIDDMDMHTECGYKMLEQVRKYLIQRNVIILMALKLDQMERVIQLEIARQYKPLKDWGKSKENNLTERSYRYMSKLLPYSHRFFMPAYGEIVNSKLIIWKRCSDDKKEGVIRHNGFLWEKVLPESTVKYAVTEMIFRKTRHLFYNSKGRVSPIVPNNLRELRHLIGMLYDMPDYKMDGNNKEQFEDYFKTSWVTQNLNAKGKEIFNTIDSISDTSTFNKVVVQKLYTQFQQYFTTWDNDSEQEEIKYIVDIQNAPYNVSIGDAFVLIIYLKNFLTDEMDLKLLFAIETIYSIRLYDYYRDMVDADTLNINNQNAQVFQRDLLDGVSKYQQLVAGSFINSKYFRLLTPNGKPKYQEEDNWRSVTKVSISIFNKLITRWYIRDSKIVPIKEDPFKGLLVAMELTALLISRKKYNTKDKDKYDASYRKNVEVVYYNQSKKGSPNVLPYSQSQTVYLDVASLFFNITDIKLAYDKTSVFLYRIANHHPFSLLNQLRKITINRYNISGDEKTDCYDYNQEVGLYQKGDNWYVKLDVCGGKEKMYPVNDINKKILSWCSIRNAEILESFILHLSIFGLGSNVDLLQFLRNASDFSIKKYQLSENEQSNNTISFDYIKLVLDLFTNQDFSKYEKFLHSRRRSESFEHSATDLDSLADSLVENGYRRESINLRIRNVRSFLLNNINREELIVKLEKRRKILEIRSWSKKTFLPNFKIVYDSIVQEDRGNL